MAGPRLRDGSLMNRIAPSSRARSVACVAVCAVIAWTKASAAQPLVEPLRVYLAAPFDQDGKLVEALPLYEARAKQTRSVADRLRYAGALLRFGRYDEAQLMYGGLMKEGGSVEQRGEQPETTAGLIASNLLLNGFPRLAIPYAQIAHRAQPNDSGMLLLLVRTLCASGDAPGARALMAQAIGAANAWPAGRRIELARWQAASGNAQAAEKLMAGEIPESLLQMSRDAIRAFPLLRTGEWLKASRAFDNSLRKAPATLSDARRVDRAWRNAQREVRSIYLRRAISLWQQGKTEWALADIAKAQASDEEYVRSSAIVLQVAADLAEDQPAAASSRLAALAGHDVRFTPVVVLLESSLAQHRNVDGALTVLQSTLADQDRSFEPETNMIVQILASTIVTRDRLQRSAAR